VKPFPFSTPLFGSLDRPLCPKEIDVLCAVRGTHPVREAVHRAVAPMGGSARVDFEVRPWGEYVDAIRRSRIAIAPRGHGLDTIRRWEIPTFDTLLLAERVPLVEEEPLLDGVHCAYYRDADELPGLLRWWLDHEEERARVAAAGMRFVRERHTNVARARRALEWVEEVYGG
jgi:hypothetical protein